MTPMTAPVTPGPGLSASERWRESRVVAVPGEPAAMMVRDRSGRMRVCIDYRALNVSGQGSATPHQAPGLGVPWWYLEVNPEEAARGAPPPTMRKAPLMVRPRSTRTKVAAVVAGTEHVNQTGDLRQGGAEGRRDREGGNDSATGTIEVGVPTSAAEAGGINARASQDRAVGGRARSQVASQEPSKRVRSQSPAVRVSREPGTTSTRPQGAAATGPTPGTDVVRQRTADVAEDGDRRQLGSHMDQRQRADSVLSRGRQDEGHEDDNPPKSRRRLDSGDGNALGDDRAAYRLVAGSPHSDMDTRIANPETRRGPGHGDARRSEEHLQRDATRARGDAIASKTWLGDSGRLEVPADLHSRGMAAIDLPARSAFEEDLEGMVAERVATQVRLVLREQAQERERKEAQLLEAQSRREAAARYQQAQLVGRGRAPADPDGTRWNGIRQGDGVLAPDVGSNTGLGEGTSAGRMGGTQGSTRSGTGGAPSATTATRHFVDGTMSQPVVVDAAEAGDRPVNLSWGFRRLPQLPEFSEKARKRGGRAYVRTCLAALRLQGVPEHLFVPTMFQRIPEEYQTTLTRNGMRPDMTLTEFERALHTTFSGPSEVEQMQELEGIRRRDGESASDFGLRLSMHCPETLVGAEYTRARIFLAGMGRDVAPLLPAWTAVSFSELVSAATEAELKIAMAAGGAHGYPESTAARRGFTGPRGNGEAEVYCATCDAPHSHKECPVRRFGGLQAEVMRANAFVASLPPHVQAFMAAHPVAPPLGVVATMGAVPMYPEPLPVMPVGQAPPGRGPPFLTGANTQEMTGRPQGGDGSAPQCFGCGGTGHIRRFCPRDPDGGDRGYDGRAANRGGYQGNRPGYQGDRGGHHGGRGGYQGYQGDRGGYAAGRGSWRGRGRGEESFAAGRGRGGGYDDGGRGRGGYQGQRDDRRSEQNPPTQHGPHVVTAEAATVSVAMILRDLKGRPTRVGNVEPGDGGNAVVFPPAKNVQGQLYVRATVAFSATEGWTAGQVATVETAAVVDSGAQITTMTQRLAERLGVPLVGAQVLACLGRESLAAHRTPLCVVDVAGARMRGVLWVVTNIPGGVDMLLGMDFLTASLMGIQAGRELVSIPATQVGSPPQSAPGPASGSIKEENGQAGPSPVAPMPLVARPTGQSSTTTAAGGAAAAAPVTGDQTRMGTQIVVTGHRTVEVLEQIGAEGQTSSGELGMQVVYGRTEHQRVGIDVRAATPSTAGVSDAATAGTDDLTPMPTVHREIPFTERGMSTQQTQQHVWTFTPGGPTLAVRGDTSEERTGTATSDAPLAAGPTPATDGGGHPAPLTLRDVLTAAHAAVGGQPDQTVPDGLRHTSETVLNVPRQHAFNVVGDGGNALNADESLVPDAIWEDVALGPTLVTREEFETLVREKMAHVTDREIRAKLRRILHNYSDLFITPVGVGGPARVEPIRIDMTEEERAKPVYIPPYAKTAVQWEEIMRQVNDLLAKGVIRECVPPSRWCSPILLAAKKDGSWRFCIDYRALNKKTLTLLRDMVTTRVVIDQLGGHSYYTSLDFLAGYWQLALSVLDQMMTAFVADKQYVWTRAPFGLKNLPMQFALRVHEIVMTRMHHVFDYFDDLTVATRSENVDEHLQAIEDCFAVLREYNIKLNLKKVVLLQRSIVVLGHLVSKEGILPDPAKVQAMVDMAVPTDVKGVQRFLGIFAFYGWMTEGLSIIAAPLHDMTRKDAVWNWSEQCQEAFDSLKDKIRNAVCMAPPRLNDTWYLVTDACRQGMAAVLAQRDDTGRERPVHFVTHRHTVSEMNWTVSSWEMGAVILAFRHFAPYLTHGTRIVVITDHKALIELLTMKDPKGKMARWIATLMQYDFTVEHRPGSENVVADALSRGFDNSRLATVGTQTDLADLRGVMNAPLLLKMREARLPWVHGAKAEVVPPLMEVVLANGWLGESLVQVEVEAAQDGAVNAHDGALVPTDDGMDVDVRGKPERTEVDAEDVGMLKVTHDVGTTCSLDMLEASARLGGAGHGEPASEHTRVVDGGSHLLSTAPTFHREDGFRKGEVPMDGLRGDVQARLLLDERQMSAMWPAVVTAVDTLFASERAASIGAGRQRGADEYELQSAPGRGCATSFDALHTVMASVPDVMQASSGVSCGAMDEDGEPTEERLDSGRFGAPLMLTRSKAIQSGVANRPETVTVGGAEASGGGSDPKMVVDEPRAEKKDRAARAGKASRSGGALDDSEVVVDAADKKRRKVMGMARPPGGEQPVAGAAERIRPTESADEDATHQGGPDPWNDEHLLTAVFRGTLSEKDWGTTETERVRVEMQPYSVVGGRLIKANPSGPMWILRPDERIPWLYERHERYAHEAHTSMVARARKDGVWWPGIADMAAAIAKRCSACQRADPAWRTMHDPARAIEVNDPHERWAADLLSLKETTTGFVGLCVVVDALTKFPMAEPIRNKTAAEVARVLRNAIAMFGPPGTLQTDNGGEFLAPEVAQLCEQFHIKRITTFPGNPQSNGQVENMNKLILAALRRMGEGNPDRWEDDLPAVLLALRSRRCVSTGFSPFRLMFGRDATVVDEWIPAEEKLLQSQLEGVMEQVRRLENLWTVVLPKARRNLVVAQTRQKHAQNRRWLLGGDLMPGQVVYLQVQQPEHKLCNKFSGPYRVIKRTAKGNYELETERGVRLSRAMPRQFLKAVGGFEMLPGEEPEDAAAFEEVLGARQAGGIWEYLVRWADREAEDPDQEEWVPEDNFASADAIRPYRRMAVNVQVMDPVNVDDATMDATADGTESPDTVVVS